MREQARILCVDDEVHILKAMKRIFMDTDYEIITASSGDEGLSILSQAHTMQVVISDYRMPEMNGVDFLHEVCKRWPDTVRIVLSGYADTASIVSAINEGEIYKFIPKPWNDDELRVTITNAVERYFLRKKNIELTIELKNKNEQLQIINENLEKNVEARTQEIIFQNQALHNSQDILDAIPIALIGLDLEGQVVWCNKMGIKLFTKAILGFDCYSVFQPEINALIDQVIKNGSQSDKITISGRLMRVKGSVMSHDGEECGVVILVEDD